MTTTILVPHNATPFDDRAGALPAAVPPKGCATAFFGGLALILWIVAAPATATHAQAPGAIALPSPILADALAQVRADQGRLKALETERKELRRELDRLKGRR